MNANFKYSDHAHALDAIHKLKVQSNLVYRISYSESSHRWSGYSETRKNDEFTRDYGVFTSFTDTMMQFGEDNVVQHSYKDYVENLDKVHQLCLDENLSYSWEYDFKKKLWSLWVDVGHIDVAVAGEDFNAVMLDYISQVTKLAAKSK